MMATEVSFSALCHESGRRSGRESRHRREELPDVIVSFFVGQPIGSPTYYLSPCFPFRVSFDPEDLRIEGNPFRVNPSPQCGEGGQKGVRSFLINLL